MTKTAEAQMQIASDDEPTEALDRRSEQQDATLAMIERFVTDPDVDVDKLDRLLQMQERMQEKVARADFWADFAQMQQELPEIGERGQILNKSGQVVATYAKFEDIMDAVRPVLREYGFSLSFRTGQESGQHETTGILAHRSGHFEQTTFRAPSDESGFKNKIQGIGSAQSYGKRYTTIALLNLTTRGVDDDGQSTGRKVEQPDGYDNWRADMELVAEDGVERFREAWKGSDQKFRDFAAAEDKQWLAKMKATAGRAS